MKIDASIPERWSSGATYDLAIGFVFELPDVASAARTPTKLYQGRTTDSAELWLEPIPPDLATQLARGCEPQGTGTTEIVRHPYCNLHYALVWGPRPREQRWDCEQAINKARVILELLRPSGFSLRYSSAITISTDRRVGDQLPEFFGGLGADIYPPTLDPIYYTQEDVDRAATLVPLWEPGRPFPERISKALWMYPYIESTKHLDVRWALLASALEALFGTSDNNVSLQFRTRVSAVAQELGLSDYTAGDAKQAYKERSHHVHGGIVRPGQHRPARPEGPAARRDSDPHPLYRRTEEVYRRILIRCIEDHRFAAHFDTIEAIRARWPVIQSY